LIKIDEMRRKRRRMRLPIEVTPDLNRTLDEVMRTHTLAVLTACHGNMMYAARVLGIDRKTISRWLRKWGVVEE
jgi:transcriptional regulator of acetoin/glycerol metabolism